MGYCFGVRRAMDLAFQRLDQSRGRVYSHGPMIHNRQAMEFLTKRGLRPWPEDPSGADIPEGSSVIIRAHGLAPDAEAALRAAGVAVVDATCPMVAEVQRLVAAEAAAGADPVIWGAAGHPEVDGLMGYAAGRGRVVSGPAEVADLPALGRVVLVSQTTQNLELWPEVERAILSRFPGARCVNTICRATVNRQGEARRLAAECQALVVVGDRHSGNTRRLYEVGLAEGIRTISVEGPDDIDPRFLEGVETVGLVSGASTPVWQSRLVQQRLLSLDRSRANSPPAFLVRLLRALVLSNIYVGLGAGCLGWAVARVMGFGCQAQLFGLLFFFTQALHALNGYLDFGGARYNDLDRAEFLAKYRRPLMALSLGSMAMALSAAFLAGPWVAAFVGFLTVLTALYAVPWPVSPLGRWGVRRLKDIPLSKSLCTAAGWASLQTVPALLSRPPLAPAGAAGLELAGWAFGAVFFQVFCRCLRVDFQDSLGDRIFGRRTAVTLLGWRRAMRLLTAALAVWTLWLVAAALRHPGTPLLWILIPGPLLNLALLPRFVKKGSLGGFWFDAALDGQFILAGLGAWLWPPA
jgi:4-hydroxy-3-methylbut-2-enyl diphosphate reductase